MNDEWLAWLFLNRILNMGPLWFHKLLRAARSAAAILKLDAAGLEALGVPPLLAAAWSAAFRSETLHKEAEQEIELLQKNRLGVMTELDPGYPDRLRELSDRPPVLYYLGHWPEAPHWIGLVGTRKASAYGLGVAEQLSKDLARRGVVTVSGLASGIDTAVHRATLEAGGTTVAVLGNGLGQVFPRENTQLQEQISKKGLVVSEFPYATQPDARHFPRRNRIISGLSQGVVVVEAGHRSGALITARCSAEQGRDVFAVPHPLGSPLAAGGHRLLKQGAKLVESAEDIVEEWTTDLPYIRENQAPEPTPVGLEPDEQRVLSSLGRTGVSLDELVERLALPVDRLGSALLNLELKGLVKTIPGQRYAKS